MKQATISQSTKPKPASKPRFATPYDKALFYIRQRQKEMYGVSDKLLTLGELSVIMRMGLKKLLSFMEEQEGININVGIQIGGGGGHAKHEDIRDYSFEDLAYWDELDAAVAGKVISLRDTLTQTQKRNLIELANKKKLRLMVNGVLHEAHIYGETLANPIIKGRHELIWNEAEITWEQVGAMGNGELLEVIW